jgi:hypothetical protein
MAGNLRLAKSEQLAVRHPAADSAGGSATAVESVADTAPAAMAGGAALTNYLCDSLFGGTPGGRLEHCGSSGSGSSSSSSSSMVAGLSRQQIGSSGRSEQLAVRHPAADSEGGSAAAAESVADTAPSRGSGRRDGVDGLLVRLAVWRDIEQHIFFWQTCVPCCAQGRSPTCCWA